MGDAITQPDQGLIDGRYRITGRIASGGMATVYQAMDERLDRSVAIKVMHAQLAQGPHRDEYVARFHREARSAATLASPHIVQVYDTGEWRGREFLVMEYVHGVTLRSEMERRGVFDVRSTLRIVAETLDGLAAAHRAGLVHRDVKPENILINDRGRVQITDFGLAKAIDQATLSSTGMLLGTASYLAPELIERNEATPQGDLYAVGIMAWEMLTGDVPYVSDNPVTLVFRHVHEDVPSLVSVCAGIDSSLSTYVAHLTARDLSLRPPDADAALEELRGMAAGLPPESWSYMRPDHDTRPFPAPFPGIVPEAPSSESARAGHGTGNTNDTNNVNDTDDATDAAPSTPPALQTTTDGTIPLAVTAATTTRTTPPRVRSTRDPSTSSSSPTTVVETEEAVEASSLASPGGRHPDAALSSPTATRGGGRRFVLPLLLVAATLAIVAGGGIWWYLLGPGSYWTMPRPVGLSCGSSSSCVIRDVDWKAYRSTLKVAGIPYAEKTGYSDDVASGRVISTTPSTVGAHVSRRDGTRVTVIVSKGVRKTTVPADILDSSTTDGAKPLAALKNAGFTNIRHDEDDDQWSLDVPEGALISISVDPGTTVAHSTAVTVVLSKGPMPVSMPDVTGRSRSDAQAAFDDAKLEASYSEEYSDSVAKGKVVSTSVTAGTQLHWGDSVDVVVSKGPETAVIPSLVGKTASDATSILEGLGFSVKTQGLNILGLVQQQSATGATRLRDTNGKATVIILTVV
ncbi:protein kinase domain-containing protein [uncultured Bifidobacterium sp.]|uniref:Stk1 family PASTA domain-containing Ser/Thr kinase n=1 Tax=uncultured Bifidobacterium sp. TaxID=165187 RepID=UPI0028DBC648|nr:PASTA domain-containing protein [uncultured Bifidobacterium sp.]